MSTPVLIIEDETILARNITAYLLRHGYDAVSAASGEEGIAKAVEHQPDVILLDYQLPSMTGLQALDGIRARGLSSKVVILTGNGNIDVAVQAMKAGAFDYLSKPVALSELKLLIDKAVDHQRLERRLNYLSERQIGPAGLDSLLGESPPMAELKSRTRRLIQAEYALTDNDAPAVLITGETGTGKELIARALHFEGPRKKQPFVEINCAALPAHLLEAELFGYERGAFTDARERKPGLVEAAEGGTLFLDEIGEMDLALQSKLVKVLEEKKVRRLGGLREHQLNFRLLSATNQDLELRIREGKFRADLYYRLRTMHLALPPLRTRGSDILLLADAFLKMHGTRYRKPGLHFTREAQQKLLHAPWIGNVREMKNTLEQTVLMAQEDAIQADQLSVAQSSGSCDRTAIAAAPSFAEPQLPGHEMNLERMERDYLLKALNQTNWNVTRASKLLGLSRDTMRYRMEKHRLKNPL